MADIFGGDTDYSKTIDKLVEIRSKPLKKYEKQEEDFKQKVGVLSEFQKDIINLQLVATKLYGFDSGFKKRDAKSSDESVLESTALQGAENNNYKILVKHVAQSNKISSKTFKLPEELPKSNFKFIIGEKEFPYHFPGGNFEALRTMIATKGDPIRLEFVKLKKDKGIVVLSTDLKGKKNEIKLDNDSGNLFEELKLYSPSVDKNISIFKDSKQESRGNVKSEFDGKKLVLKPGSGENFSKEIPQLTEKSYIELSFKWDNTQPTKEKLYTELTETEKEKLAKELDLTDSSKKYSVAYLPTNVDEYNIVLTITYDVDGNVEQKNYKIGMSDFFSSKKKMPKFDFGNLFSEGQSNVTIKDVTVKSNELYREVTLDKMNVLVKADPSKKYTAYKVLQQPEDALIVYEGIEIERESNEIKDVIPRVSLILKKPSKDPVEISISSDKDKSKQRLTDFLGQYNYVMKKINIFLGKSEIKPAELEEKELKDYGLFKGEATLLNLRNRLIFTVSGMYKTRRVDKFFILDQLGISLFRKNATANMNNLDDMNYGLIDFKEEKYDTFAGENSDIIADLFGFDSNKDGIVDEGFAYKINNISRQYIGPGSSFTLKISSWNSQVKEMGKKIEKEKSAIDEFKGKQSIEFGKLRQAQAQMKKMQQMLKAYGK